MGHESLEGGPDNIVFATVAVFAPRAAVGDPKVLQDFLDQRVAAETPVGRPQNNLAGVGSSHEVPCKSVVLVPVDKENVALAMPGCRQDSVAGVGRFASAKSTASIEVS